MGAKTYTPQETTEILSRAGAAKGNMRLDKVFLSSVNAGMILSFACASHLSIQSSPWFQENAAGLIRALGALVFPYGTLD
jgi:formate/nitrite transporter FocA (FNT family)